MYSKVKVNNGSVIIYYAKDGEMRFPTGVIISKKKSKDGFFVEFDDKKGEVRKIVENSDEQNKIIRKWLERANNIIDDFLLKGIKLSSKELRKALDNWQQDQQFTYSTSFLEAFEGFYNAKKEELVDGPKKSEESFKTYTTFKNTIIEFEIELGLKLVLNDVLNKKWLSTFDKWLQKARPKIKELNGVPYKFKTKGKAKERTRDKRLEVLSGFVTYLTDEGIIENTTFQSVLTAYRKSNINITPKIKTTLTIDEIHDLYKKDLKNETLNNVVKLFLFSCLTGFRWKDIKTFQTHFIQEENGKLIYKYIANKTKHKVSKIAKIPLCKLAIKILEDLNYELNFITNAKANFYIKEALEKSSMFDGLTFVEDDVTGRQKKRWEIISMHRGRDSFITNLIGTVPIHELMVYTSHEKISTLQTYIDFNRPINPNYINIFDR